MICTGIRVEKETEMKKMKNKKRCYALAEYMEAAACSDDSRDRVAACPVAAAQGLSSP